MSNNKPERKRQQTRFNPFINFETQETEWVAESTEARRKRLAAERAERKAIAFSDRRRIDEARTDALTLAWQCVYGGESMPIHYDLLMVSGEFTKLERYSLLDAAFTENIFDPTQLVGSKGAIKLKRGRRADIAANFLHTVKIG